MNSVTFTLTGGVNVAVVVTELESGGLQFDLTVLDETGSIGDLNGLFLDLADDSVLAGLSMEGDDVTGTAMRVDGVTKVSGFNNVNGEIANEYGKFDLGVEFGTSGISKDDIRQTSFTLEHSDMDLGLADILGQDFALRLTSVGAEEGNRNDSLKLGGTAPDEPDAPPPPPEPVHLAVNDSLTVDEYELFSLSGDGDVLDSGATSVLVNDLTDTFVYSGQVQAANGDSDNVGQVIAGSNGGVMIIMPDGGVDFSSGPDFEYLNEGESALTSFTYGIEGGSTATIDVTVLGADGPPDGGGGGFPPIDIG